MFIWYADCSARALKFMLRALLLSQVLLSRRDPLNWKKFKGLVHFARSPPPDHPLFEAPNLVSISFIFLHLNIEFGHFFVQTQVQSMWLYMRQRIEDNWLKQRCALPVISFIVHKVMCEGRQVILMMRIRSDCSVHTIGRWRDSGANTIMSSAQSSSRCRLPRKRSSRRVMVA